MMKPIISIISLVIILTGCMGNEASIYQKEWYKQFENKPLTEKEMQYVKQLEKRGFNKIDIQPPYIGVEANGFSWYSITMSSKIQHTNKNKDSIYNVNYEIAKELYRNIIEDSILLDIHTISVTLNVENSFEKGSIEEFYNSYSKAELEKELKFKVIRKEDNTIERVTLK